MLFKISSTELQIYSISYRQRIRELVSLSSLIMRKCIVKFSQLVYDTMYMQ